MKCLPSSVKSPYQNALVCFLRYIQAHSFTLPFHYALLFFISHSFLYYKRGHLSIFQTFCPWNGLGICISEILHCFAPPFPFFGKKNVRMQPLKLMLSGTNIHFRWPRTFVYFTVTCWRVFHQSLLPICLRWITVSDDLMVGLFI